MNSEVTTAAPVVPGSLGPVTNGVEANGSVRPTVRVVKRPSSGSVAGASKVRIGEGGQQYRIVTAAAGGLVNIGGQTLKLISAPSLASVSGGVSGNLKTIVPSEASNLVNHGGNISIVNKDGSIHPVASMGQQVKISAGGQLGPGVKHQLRILPNNQQNIRIVNADGSVSDVVKPGAESSPKKIFTLKSSPQKIQMRPGDTNPVLRTSDGRIITLQAGAKKVLLPSSASSSSSPTKIIIRDSQVRSVNGQPSDKIPTLSKPAAGQLSSLSKPAGGQLIRLTPEIASSLAQSSDNKVQFVRVVGGSVQGGGVQTLTLKQGLVNNVQGLKTVVPGQYKGEKVIYTYFSYQLQLYNFCRRGRTGGETRYKASD